MIGGATALRLPGGGGPLPQPGTAVWLEDLAGGPVGSQAVEVRPPHLRIDPPRRGGETVPLPDGLRVALTYQAQQVPCEARAVVAPAPAGCDGGPWLRIAHVHRLQRRGAVRVPVNLIARVRGGDEEVEAGVGEAAVTEDLSANGALLRLAIPLEVGDAVRLTVHLGGRAGDVLAEARVVRVDHEPESARPWRVGLAFPDLGRGDEDRVVRFLFERQRELRRREAGLT